jgi:crotonobetaine/carnitine-CoA ligase
MVTWAQTYMTMIGCFPSDDLASDDHWYVPYPLFHMSGRLCVYGAALRGSAAVIGRRFSRSAWWDDIDTHRCTTALIIGLVPQLLSTRPRTPANADHTLRHVQMAPMPKTPTSSQTVSVCD